MKLTKRECLVGGPASRAGVIESRFAAYSRCSTDDRRIRRWFSAAFACLGLLLSPSGQATGQESATKAELEAVCREVLCRQPGSLPLRLKDGKVIDAGPSLPTPIVTGSLITVLPGETVMVEGTLKEGRLTDLVAVPRVTEPERTLVLTFTQDPSRGEGLDMLLKIQSPFPGVLKYRLGLMLPDGDRLLSTSSCPLQQGIPVYEHWPYPLFQVVAADFRQVDPSSEAASKCE